MYCILPFHYNFMKGSILQDGTFVCYGRQQSLISDPTPHLRLYIVEPDKGHCIGGAAVIPRTIVGTRRKAARSREGGGGGQNPADVSSGG